MDQATELAFRAIVQSFFASGVVNADQVRGLIGALKDAAAGAMERHDPDTAKQLIGLCKRLRVDTAVGVHEHG